MKNSVDISLPQCKTVRGYEVKRMPIGRFLQAARLLEQLPELLLGTLFPDSGEQDALELLRHLDRNALQRVIPRLLTALPEQAIQLFSRLSDIPEKELLESPAIGLDGLCELAEAWWEVNGLGNFTLAASALVGRVQKLTTRTGSNS